MKKKLNNKGYMLIEIILAFAIAFALLYFIMDLVIKLKNKNDDLLVKTLIYSDQAIITNELMELAISEKESFNCNLLTIDGKAVKYNSKVLNVVDKYATIGSFDNTRDCTNVGNKISIKIPMNVKQMPDKNFDVKIQYKYKVGNAPMCYIEKDPTTSKVYAAYRDDDSDIIGYYFGSSAPLVSTTYIALDYEGYGYIERDGLLPGTYYFSVKDDDNNIEECSITIE